ncbi:ACT domain-containing protein [Bacteroidales bacterium OttesenSCG-928-A17]|nr:ACT domain-containing protein [Bacteroidales bacterium OttesenSCG-928-A17]
MLIKQLSIFLENKKGRFTEVARILGDAGINMTALTVAENSDFGILRLVVSDPETARKILKEHRYAVSINNVICIQTPNKPGSLAQVMDIITAAGIFVEYMYAFSFGVGAVVIIRPDDLEKALKVLSENKVELLASDELFSL